MPKTYARKTKKRFQYRRKKRYGKSLVLSKAPIPNKFATKLRYSESVSVNPSVGGIPGVYVFNASSCYDPDFTGIGHQPRGFDQWMSMFDHFTVIGSKITVQYAIQGQTDDRSLLCGLNLKDGATAYTDKNDYMEGRNVTSRLVAGGGAGDARTCKLGLTYSPKKFLGISKALANQAIKGSASSNPTENAYFHCWVAPTGTADLDTLALQVVIDYLVVFTEPKNPSQS